MEISDEELALQFQKGNKETFDKIVFRYKDKVVNFAYRFLRNREEAEDVAVETFIRVYQNLPNYDTNRSFPSWFYKIAMNLILNRIRQIKSHPLVSLSQKINEEITLEETIPSSKDSPEKSLIKKERIEKIRKAVSLLPEHLRSVIIMREYQDLNYEEIASILNCPIGTVRSRIFRAREILKEMLKDLIEEEL